MTAIPVAQYSALLFGAHVFGKQPLQVQDEEGRSIQNILSHHEQPVRPVQVSEIGLFVTGKALSSNQNKVGSIRPR
jgi:hypothetical protein